jgi:hypothetical protein
MGAVITTGRVVVACEAAPSNPNTVTTGRVADAILV